MRVVKPIQVSVSTGIVIAAAPADVFRYLVNLKYHYLWNPHLQSVSPMKPLAEGSSYKSESLIMGITIKGTNFVVKCIQAKELVLENRLGTIHYQIRFRLSQQGTKTKINCSTTVTPESKAFTYAVSILKKLAQRELQSDMQALKIAVEERLG